MKKPIASSVYELLTNQEDARACRDIPESACKNSPDSFLLLLISYCLTKLGDAIANPKTVLPWLLTSVNAPLWILGFLVPIRESGSLIPQLVIADFVRRMPIRKWAWVAGALIQALAIVFMGFAAVRFTGTVAGLLILGSLIVFSLARGLCSVAAKDVLGKTIPKGRRGQLNGWSASFAGLVTVVIGVALLRPIADADTTALYGYALVGAAFLWLTAAGVYSAISEVRGETAGGENGFLTAIKRLSLLREDADFRRFVITRSLLLCSALSAPYFVALAQSRIGTNTQVLATFIIASGMASLISAPVWGRLTDQSSRQVMSIAAALTATVGVLVALASYFFADLTKTYWFLPCAYFLLSIAHAGVRVGRKTYIVDLAGGNKRTDYVAVSNSVIGIVLLGTGIIGTLAAWISISGVIAVLSLMGAAGALAAKTLPEK